MRKAIMMLAIALMGVAAQAKDIKTVIFTTQPQMHCAGCEKKIKGNLRYEKGVKRIDTSVDEQKVTVKYDADKTSADKLQKAFEKIGYKASLVNTSEKAGCKGCKAKNNEKTGCKGCKAGQDKTDKKSESKAPKSCCSM